MQRALHADNAVPALCAFPHTVIVMSRDIEQGPEGECAVFSPFPPLFPLRRIEGIAWQGEAAAQPQHDERPEIGVHPVPVGDI